MSSTSPLFEIKLFGPFDARVDGVPIPPLRSRRGQWILALLALRLDREVERDWLAATVWPDSDPDQALPTLRRTLTDVRNALGDAAHYLTSPTPHSLRLIANGVSVDVHTFDKLVAEKDEESLKQAVELYAPLLEDCGEEWAVQERAAKTETYLSSLEKLAQELSDKGEFTDAARYLRVAVTTDPFRESVRQNLMRVLAVGGSLSEALECYRDYRILLRRELNTEPGPVSADLYRTLREGRVNLPRPYAQAVVSIAAKPAASSAVRLPIPITPFVGRVDDIDNLASMLAETRLLTLTGPGGIGKTRLAIESARTAAVRFPDGVWFVDLSAITEGGLIPSAVSNTLGIREQPGREYIETLREELGSKSLLLVLDNCEHQIESCAALAKRLLSECPGVHILATSRQRLGISGEMTWQVPPLSMPPEGKLVNILASGSETLMGRYEAIRLFVERAQTAMPVFQMNEQTAKEIVDVCRRLEGMPLALELAAARVRVLSISDISRRLADRFRLLNRGDQTSPQRQQTLRGAIDWSYDLLSETEKRFFARLAVFSGGWNLEAAEFVCADPESVRDGIASDDILDLLTDLVDRSLVSVEGGVEGVTRYRMMEAIREYAMERLYGREDEADTRKRHKEFYVSFAHRARQEVHGSEQTIWLARINQEYGNFRAVLSGATDAETLYKMVAYLWQYWLVRGHYREGVHWVRLALREEGDEYYDYRIKALEGGAILSTEISDFETADCWFKENLALRRRFGNQAHISFALNNYALSLMYRNRHQEARPMLEESLVYKRKTNDRHGIAMSTGNLGNIMLATGNLEAAERLFRESLEICLEVKDAHNICWSYGNLASLLGRTGREREAFHLYQECLRIASDMVDVRNTGVVIARMGMLLYHTGEQIRGTQLVSLGYEMQLRSLNNPLLPADQMEMDRWIEMLKAALGERAFNTAWNSGKLLEPEAEIATLLSLPFLEQDIVEAQ